MSQPVPRRCEIPGCDRPVSMVPDIEDGEEQPLEFPIAVGDLSGRYALCDECSVAARILGYTRSEPPYVDIGLYQEVVFYARQLAAYHLIDTVPNDVVIHPEESADTEERERHDTE